MEIPDYPQWVRDKQRVLVRDERGGEAARGTVVAYLPPSVVVDLDGAGQAGLPVTQVRPLSSDDAPEPTITALVAAGGAPDVAAAERLQQALRTAGYELVARKTRGPK
jgi:hypothetical protein